MWMPMQGIKFRDFMSLCCLYFILRSGSPASAKLKKCKGKSCFALGFCASVKVGVMP